MVDFSANDLFDMGSSSACEKLGPDVANYAVLELYLTTVPSFIKMGFCIPTTCSNTALDLIVEKVEFHLQDVCIEIFGIEGATLNAK
jgi:hypothetical protein